MTLQNLFPRFDRQGLIPAIVQDANSGQILTLAYMNEIAFQRTLETGETHFWSRSRSELWHKGATSGNTQRVVEMLLDCDQDAILLSAFIQRDQHVIQVRFLVFTTWWMDFNHLKLAIYNHFELFQKRTNMFSINDLYTIICQRRDNPSQKSYTAHLIQDGEDEIVKKVGEEAIEVILAAKSQGNQRLIEEVSDLTYHILVLLAIHNLSPDDIRLELEKRHRPSD